MMNHRHTLPLTMAALVAALTFALPVAANAKSEGREKHRGGHASVRGEGRQSKRAYSVERRGGDFRARDSRRAFREHVDRSRARHAWNDSRSHDRVASRDTRSWRESRSPSRSRYDGGYRDPRSGWRERSRESRSREVRGRYYGDDYQPRVTSRVRYRNDGPSYSYHRPRDYYGSWFPRPRYVYRSGFSIGITIGAVPAYGYRYFDPYCDTYFSHLGSYYDHCGYHDHAHVILVMDAHGGHPIATCAYDDGYWVVDDCY